MSVDTAAPGRATGSDLRQAMRQHPAGVVVITTGRDEPTGFCATSLTSVSLDPPTVSFAVHASSASGRAWAEAQLGLVHLLSADQRDLAAHFARTGPQKFADTTRWRAGPEGQPLLEGVAAWLLVAPSTRLMVGDHLLVICDVSMTSVRGPTPPLVYHNGGYHAIPG
jgi:flavin reductase (DIM6/NTAB) family NADH-FMN oxidoreductase RutF